MTIFKCFENNKIKNNIFKYITKTQIYASVKYEYFNISRVIAMGTLRVTPCIINA